MMKKKQFEDLQVGDKVRVFNPYSGDEEYLTHVVRVGEYTFVLGTGEECWRNDGSLVDEFYLEIPEEEKESENE